MGSLLGLGGAGLAAVFMDLRPYLVLVAVASLGYSHYHAYMQPRRFSPGHRRLLWISTAAATLFISLPFLLTGEWELW